MKCIPTTLSSFYLESIVIARQQMNNIFVCIEFGKLIYDFFPPKKKIKSSLTNSETFFWICRKYKRLFRLFFVENSVATFGIVYYFYFARFFFQNIEAAYESNA